MHTAHARLPIVYHYMLLGTPNYLVILKALCKIYQPEKSIFVISLQLVLKGMSAYMSMGTAFSLDLKINCSILKLQMPSLLF